MSFLSLAQSRRSCHNFEAGFKISESEFNEILEAVRYTPSGYNAQPWKFMLIQDEAQLQKLHKICYKQDHILQAGSLVVVIGDKEFGVHEADSIVSQWQNERSLNKNKADALHASLIKEREDWKKREMCLRNCSLAAMTFLYSAQDLGFATCPMMGFRQLDLKRELGLDEHELPIMLIALGKSGETEEPQLERKSVEDITRK